MQAVLRAGVVAGDGFLLASNEARMGWCYKDVVQLLRTMNWQRHAAWMRLASFLKEEWTIEDYPIRFTFHSILKTSNASRLKPLPWAARVVNWPAMSGFGNTRLDAYGDLTKRFKEFKAKESKLPRPGSKVQVQFANRRRVQQYPELTREFVKEILGVEWAWISDESSLWDFQGEESNDRLVGKVREVYGVDVSDITSGNFADIFERIGKSRAAKS